ncbi:hypothetical protein H1D32_05965 [Anaerobacillus sp. CMMVII]|nr:hypothetical protein [Anaerobacillus sp. CMMVII]
MEKNKGGNADMPNFDKLNDRIIAEPADTPFLVMKTNLDPKDVTEDNPYYRKGQKKDTETFKNYFEQE